MKIEKIYFEQLFPTGQYANQRLGIEATFHDKELEDLADTAACYKTLKDTVEACFRAMNPEFQPEPKPSFDAGKMNATLGEINIQSEKTLIAIENSKTLSDLESHFENALKYV